MTSTRPPGLPSFESPPINELVIGVQFSQPPAYTSLNAADVRQIYQTEFPNVAEQPPLPPIFETFGTPTPPTVSFNIRPVLSHNRYWFVATSGNELIQFQPDRLLHNWRKVGTDGGVYPRFEAIVTKFERELRTLEKLFGQFGSSKLDISQCEISYVNHIVDLDPAKEPVPSEWLSFLQLSEPPSDLSVVLRRNLCAANGTPFARLTVEANTAIDGAARKLLVLQLTVRGAPEGRGIDDAINFLHFGRATAVTAFKELTTPKAHEIWRIVP